MQLGIGERIAVPAQLHALFSAFRQGLERHALIAFFGIVDRPWGGAAEIAQRNGSGAGGQKKNGGKQESLEHKFSFSLNRRVRAV